MTRYELRAFAVRWLRSKGVGSAPYRGLGRPACINFDCGCSILRDFRRGWGRSRRRSIVCADHERQLGNGSAL